MRLMKPGFSASASDCIRPLRADASLLQLGKSLPRHARVRVLHRRHHARHARGDQRLGARRCLAVMTTRFERKVNRGAARGSAGRTHGIDLGVRLPGACVKTFADDFPSFTTTQPTRGLGSAV